MNRFLSFVLILALVLGLSVPASAWGALQKWWTPSSGSYSLTDFTWEFSGFQWNSSRVNAIEDEYLRSGGSHLGMEWECRFGDAGDLGNPYDDLSLNPRDYYSSGSVTTTLPSGYSEFDSDDITIGTLRLEQVVANRSYSGTYHLIKRAGVTVPGYNASAELTWVTNPLLPQPADEEVHMGNYAGQKDAEYLVNRTYFTSSSSGDPTIQAENRVFLTESDSDVSTESLSSLSILSQASSRQRALITFNEYLTPVEVETLAEDMEIVEAYFFIPGETGRTIAPIVDNDVTGEVANVAAQLTASDDPEMVRIGNAYEEGEVGVFAISVTGEIGTLRAVQDESDSVKAIQLHSVAAASATAEKGDNAPVSIVEVPEKPDKADGVY